MSGHDFDMIVIGAGAAGLTVASGCAQLGLKTLLLEKENLLGGDCLHYGCVPSKTLLNTAKIYYQAGHMERFGLPRVELPPVDYSCVTKRIKEVIEIIQEHDSEERFCSLGVRVEYGTPEFLDEHTIRIAGRDFSSRKFALATGSSPAAPPINGLDRVTYLTNRDIFSLEKLPSRLIILGAGAIATEMAQAFSRLGSQVMVIQRSDQILSNEDRDMADEVQKRLELEGVQYYLNTQLKEVAENQGKECEVAFLDKNGQEQNVSGEQVLLALGRKPNLEGLNLEAAGVEYNKKGVPVDNKMRTNKKNIYAAGDVTGKYLFTHAAGYEGGIIVSNAAFHLPRKVDYTLLPWCTYTSPELASIGYNEKRAREAGIDYQVWTENFNSNDRSLAEGEKSGRIKLLLDSREKPIGVQILGLHAGELISEWVAALNAGMRMTTLVGSVHPYPTLAEINKSVAGKFLQPKIFSKRVQKLLKFFFHFKGRACDPSADTGNMR
ncbi:MAG: dihydrolipoyl dehydrogenase family protein [Thermodesulfobacteriota bacterium]